MRKIIVGVVCAALVAVALTACGGSSKKGFYNMKALATSYQKQYNAQPGIKLKSVDCIQTGKQEASCLGDVVGSTTDKKDGSTIHISADGLEWQSGN